MSGPVGPRSASSEPPRSGPSVLTAEPTQKPAATANPQPQPKAVDEADSRPLRILVVNWQDRENPQSGGAETHLHQVFGRLARQGDQVTLLCSGFAGAPARVTLDGIEVHRSGGRHSFAVTARRYFKRNLEGHSFDVIVEDLNKAPLFTPTWSDIPVVLLVHHLFGRTAFQEAAFPVAAATWLLERPVPRVFSGRPVIAVSHSTAEDLVERGFDPMLIQVVPNGVDLQALSPDPHGVRFPTPTLLYLGRLKRYKRVDLVMRALAALCARGVEATLLVAGQGSHQSKLEALARRLELGERVRFLGFVPEDIKLELLRRAWVHVLTSPKEGWGISNLEAAACGTPTVASDSPGLRDSVADGETGFLVPHGDVKALSERIGRLLESTDLRDGMGRAARRFAERFSWDASARDVRRVLARACNA